MAPFAKGFVRAFNPAGGFKYHLRAFRYSRRLWAPFRKELGFWLENWKPGAKKLVIIGPSGGYSLSAAFLSRFDEIVCVDPDPLAELIFRKRFSGLKVRWSNENYFSELTPRALERLEDFLRAESSCSVLFSNFLGQLGAIHDFTPLAELPKAWVEKFHQILSRRPYASYHDRFSAEMRLEFKNGETLRVDQGITNSELMHCLSISRGGGEVTDHLTGELFPKEMSRVFLLWELVPGSTHLIECVRSP